MQETPFFFPDGDPRLFAVLHAPATRTRLPAFVFCHPFAEEKLWTHRVFVSFARSLAEVGYPVLRFDYAGNGDSAGEFAASSLATARADVRTAMHEARRLTGSSRVSLLGLRLGATIASLVAEDVPEEVHDLILWSPIVDGARYMQDVLRVNLTTQMAVHKEILHDRAQLVAEMEQGHTVNVDGYEMAFPLYAEVSAVSLGTTPARYRGRCLIVQIERQTSHLLPELQKVAASYELATLTAVQEEPFWKEIPQFYQQAPKLAEATLSWLKHE